MTNVSTWQAPLPLQLGGGGTDLVKLYYDVIKSNQSDILCADDGFADIEHQAAARVMATLHRLVELSAKQRIPKHMTNTTRTVSFPEGGSAKLSILQRWERILGIRPLSNATERQRREEIAAYIHAHAGARKDQIESAMRGIFGTWFVGLGENDITDVDYSGKVPTGTIKAYWADNAYVFSADYPGEFNATYPWYSGLAHIVVAYAPPASVSLEEIRELDEKALRILDTILPAWMSVTISKLIGGQTAPGFYIGISGVGLTAL